MTLSHRDKARLLRVWAVVLENHPAGASTSKKLATSAEKEYHQSIVRMFHLMAQQEEDAARRKEDR